jgi:hypothetical protein
MKPLNNIYTRTTVALLFYYHVDIVRNITCPHVPSVLIKYMQLVELSSELGLLDWQHTRSIPLVTNLYEYK